MQRQFCWLKPWNLQLRRREGPTGKEILLVIRQKAQVNLIRAEVNGVVETGEEAKEGIWDAEDLVVGTLVGDHLVEIGVVGKILGILILWLAIGVGCVAIWAATVPTLACSRLLVVALAPPRVHLNPVSQDQDFDEAVGDQFNSVA